LIINSQFIFLYCKGLLFNFFVLDYFLFLNCSFFIFFKIVFLICLFVIIYINFYFYYFNNLLVFFITFHVFFLSILFYLISFNWILLFISWEMMGLCSFFLISTFFFRYKTRYSSFLAFFWNLLGDLFLLFFFITNLILTFYFNILIFYFVYLYFLLIIFAILCKSAVFPFHAWLYYAMEGPTPVSAFLHAASMITAGVYFFFIFPLFLLNLKFIYLCFFSTIFFSLNAYIFFDMKKIIASSTGSQLGYIIFFFSINLNICGILLFTFHAIFKSILFFIAGFIISLFYNYQDLRYIKFNFPLFLITIVCFLALLGLFFFWSGIIKEIFISYALNNFIYLFIFIYFFIFSLIYSFKFYYTSLFKFLYFDFNLIKLFFTFIFISSIFVIFILNIFYYFSLPSFFYFYFLGLFLIILFYNKIIFFVFDFLYNKILFYLLIIIYKIFYIFYLIYFIFFIFI